MKNEWLDNHSWNPDLLMDKYKAKVTPFNPLGEEEPVEPNQIERATGVHSDPIPGTIEYLRLGCDHLYTDLGGES